MKLVPPAGAVCVYCAIRPAEVLDHVLPRSRGGTDLPDNLVPACWRCNDAKNARTPAEWIVYMWLPGSRTGRGSHSLPEVRARLPQLVEAGLITRESMGAAVDFYVQRAHNRVEGVRASAARRIATAEAQRESDLAGIAAALSHLTFEAPVG